SALTTAPALSAPATGAPQPSQNRAPGSRSLSHVVQRARMRTPHAEQNRASSRFTSPHAVHRIPIGRLPQVSHGEGPGGSALTSSGHEGGGAADTDDERAGGRSQPQQPDVRG